MRVTSSGSQVTHPETIELDIRIIQKELPVDLLEFFLLTPLPGSEDHKGFCSILNGYSF